MSHAALHDRDWGVLTVILAAIGIAIVVTVLKGQVHDLGTAGSLFSILALHVGVIVYVVARRLSIRMRRARLLSLRREDRRNKDYLAAMINLCRSLALGARASGPDSPEALSAMQHVAHALI